MTVPIESGGEGSMAYDTAAGEMVAEVTAITSPPPYIWPSWEWETWVLAGASWSRAAGASPSTSLPLTYDAATHQLVSVDASPYSPTPTATTTWIYGSTSTSNVIAHKGFWH